MVALPDTSERIEQELTSLARQFAKPPLSAIPSRHREAILTFVLRRGKRLRPKLFLTCYGGYAPAEVPNLYKAAISLELLHAFILVHDDIVDGSRVRRGAPSMHALFDDELRHNGSARFSGEDVAMIVGDMLYAVGINMFLSVEAAAERKQQALEYLTLTAIYTACGELKELFDTLAPPVEATTEGISQSSQWKTAYYSFACPMVTGAILAGAGDADVKALRGYALSVGLAFQIKDDIEDLTGSTFAENGDSALDDLREGKLTLPVWYALHHGSRKDREGLARIIGGGKTSHRDLAAAHSIILRAGGVQYAKNEVDRILRESRGLLDSLAMTVGSRDALWRHTTELLQVREDVTERRHSVPTAVRLAPNSTRYVETRMKEAV